MNRLMNHLEDLLVYYLYMSMYINYYQTFARDSKIKYVSRIYTSAHEYCKGLMNDLYVTCMRLYGCIQTVDTNSYPLPECHYSRYENITKTCTRNVYTRIMILYSSICLVYAFVLTHSLRCVTRFEITVFSIYISIYIRM